MTASEPIRPIALQPRGVDPADLPPGHYRVRSGDRWRIAKWSPAKRRWSGAGGHHWVARHFDEIGEKVA